MGPTSLRSTVCFCLLMMAKPQPYEVVVDPLCGGGSISLEVSARPADSGCRVSARSRFRCRLTELASLNEDGESRSLSRSRRDHPEADGAMILLIVTYTFDILYGGSALYAFETLSNS